MEKSGCSEIRFKRALMDGAALLARIGHSPVGFVLAGSSLDLLLSLGYSLYETIDQILLSSHSLREGKRREEESQREECSLWLSQEEISPLLRRSSSIDGNHLAGDIARALRGQEEHGGSNLTRPADAPERGSIGNDRFGSHSYNTLGHACPKQAGGDTIHANVVMSPFDR